MKEKVSRSRRHQRGMKMFWGVFFVVLGVILLVNYVFGIDLPIFRILVSVGIIYIGLKILFGSFGVDIKKVATDRQALFSESEFEWSGSDEKQNFQTVFGKSILDLRSIELKEGNAVVRLDTVFGKTKIHINEGMPFKIESEAVLGSIKMKERRINGIGETSFLSDNFDANKPHILIKAAAVFGEIEILVSPQVQSDI